MQTFINSQNLSRKELAQKLAMLVLSFARYPDFEAYAPGDNQLFVIDRNNDYKVVFSRNDNACQIWSRYGNDDAQINILTEAIASWN